MSNLVPRLRDVNSHEYRSGAPTGMRATCRTHAWREGPHRSLQGWRVSYERRQRAGMRSRGGAERHDHHWQYSGGVRKKRKKRKGSCEWWLEFASHGASGRSGVAQRLEDGGGATKERREEKRKALGFRTRFAALYTSEIRSKQSDSRRFASDRGRVKTHRALGQFDGPAVGCWALRPIRAPSSLD